MIYWYLIPPYNEPPFPFECNTYDECRTPCQGSIYISLLIDAENGDEKAQCQTAFRFCGTGSLKFKSEDHSNHLEALSWYCKMHKSKYGTGIDHLKKIPCNKYLLGRFKLKLLQLCFKKLSAYINEQLSI
jgi:hypothetical protein